MEEQKKRGRPPKYNPKVHPEIARNMYMKGHDDSDVAEYFGVAEVTLSKWAKAYPEFAIAQNEGKAHTNNRVTETIKKMIFGYDYEETESKPSVVIPRDKNGHPIGRGRGRPPKVEMVVTKVVKKHMPPNAGVVQFFARNRMKELYPDTNGIKFDGSMNNNNMNASVIDMSPEERKRWLEEHGYTKKE